MNRLGENKELPLVSIIIPVYNGSDYMREAIDSALNQTYPNLEILVVNDGSGDDGATERIALSYGDKIRYFSKENGGSSSALNMGIANMTGDWFSWLSHDDLYVPKKLEKQISCMQALKLDDAVLSKHIYFSASELINAEGKTIRRFRTTRAHRLAKNVADFPHNGYLISEPTVYNFHGCSCLIHKDAFADVGCFDEKLRLLNDVDFWFRLYSADYKLHYIPEPLVKGRVHGAQVSKRIGYSYHNPEQDMFWKRSLHYLMQNYPKDSELFYRFGRNAYLKTRTSEGDRAFAHLAFIKPAGKATLPMLKWLYKFRAGVRGFAKKIYLKLKI